MTSRTDRIEKTVELRASVARVWRALADSREFGTWFGMRFEGPFVPGKPAAGVITIPEHEGLPVTFEVEQMVPERLFSYRWHPYPIDHTRDYAEEPTTLVEFRLEPAPGGTRLTVIESGFDAIPAGRRTDAYRANSEGWGIQIENLTRHVTA